MSGKTGQKRGSLQRQAGLGHAAKGPGGAPGPSLPLCPICVAGLSIADSREEGKRETGEKPVDKTSNKRKFADQVEFSPETQQVAHAAGRQRGQRQRVLRPCPGCAVNLAVPVPPKAGGRNLGGRPLPQASLRPSGTGSEEGRLRPGSPLRPEKGAQGGLPEEQGAGSQRRFWK